MRPYRMLLLPLLFLCPTAAVAQGLGAGGAQQRFVTIVVPFAPGGSTDLEGRLYAQSLSESTGRRFIVDNRAGRGGSIGAAYVAKAAPDGNTLLAITGSIATAPALYKNLGFDPIMDFAPLSLMSERTSILLVHPSVPVRSLKGYIRLVKARPNELNFGSSGAGGAPHLAAEWLHGAAKAKVTFVHYKGAGPMLLDLVTGRVQSTILTPLSSVPYIKSGKLIPLAVTSAKRSPLFPDLPTVSEQGIPDYDFSSWLGIFAPARTPSSVVSRLNSELATMAKRPEVVRRLVEDGGVMVGSTPDELRETVAREVARWKKVVQEAGITAGQ